MGACSPFDKLRAKCRTKRVAGKSPIPHPLILSLSKDEPPFALSCAQGRFVKDQLVRSFTHAALSPDPDLAIAALMIARVEYPKLDAGPYLDQLDAFGREARTRVAEASQPAGDVFGRVDPVICARVMALNDYLFRELRFVGNETQYEDPRNSFLNEVLERRTGIPISLALLYMEVARRAELHVEGINFPGHFLLRCPARRGPPYNEDLIIDAFHGGALLSEEACRELLRRHAGGGIVFGQPLLAHATKPQILARMLLNLKLLYVRMHSFPQARDVTELLLAVDPSGIDELRDRGLLAYQLKDFSAALRDLQAYLQLSASTAIDEAAREEQAHIWEHVKTLRRRVAMLN
jgi:regulator of sirC expression with transglutaminase-like and TPR domain